MKFNTTKKITAAILSLGLMVSIVPAVAQTTITPEKAVELAKQNLATAEKVEAEAKKALDKASNRDIIVAKSEVEIAELNVKAAQEKVDKWEKDYNKKVKELTDDFDKAVALRKADLDAIVVTKKFLASEKELLADVSTQLNGLVGFNATDKTCSATAFGVANVFSTEYVTEAEIKNAIDSGAYTEQAAALDKMLGVCKKGSLLADSKELAVKNIKVSEDALLKFSTEVKELEAKITSFPKKADLLKDGYILDQKLSAYTLDKDELIKAQALLDAKKKDLDKAIKASPEYAAYVKAVENTKKAKEILEGLSKGVETAVPAKKEKAPQLVINNTDKKCVPNTADCE